MAYTPRLTDTGMQNNPYWYSENPFYQSGYGLPNCTCYAWGRVYEYLGTKPTTSLGNAEEWYNYNKNNNVYAYGSSPALGAIICFSHPTSGGHVGIVEKIEGTTVTTSNSAYGGTYFYLQEFQNNQFSHGDYTFQGFIYPYEGGGGGGPVDPSDGSIRLGGYNTGVVQKTPTIKHTYQTEIDIPWQFTDFRNLQPYTSFLLWLPAVGFVNLNPNDLIGKEKLFVQLDIDGITGKGVYVIGNYAKFNADFSTDVQIGTVAGSPESAINGILQGLSNAYSANPFGAVTSAISGLLVSQERQLGVVGSTGGAGTLNTSPVSDWRYLVLFTICHDTNVQPSSVQASIGRPLRAVRTLGNLSGYCQTNGASVSVDNIDIAEQINNLLDGGVYIE